MTGPLFERAFVISLRDRPQRLANFRESLPEAQWLPEVETWWAINGQMCPPPDNWHAGGGAWGCYRSHMQIMEYCLNNRVTSYIVFEDDAQFADNFADAHEFIENVPDDWQQIYLGGQLMHAKTHRPRRINSHVLRPYNVNRTHCFALSRPGMEAVYQHCSRLPFERTFHIDHHLGRFHEDARNAIYCPLKWYVGQHGFRSDISGKDESVQFYASPEKYATKSKYPNILVVYRANPVFRNECQAFLHFGNQVGRGGYDIALEAAALMKNPARQLNYWWGFVSQEAFDTGRLPAFHQPDIDDETLERCLPGVKFIPITSASSVEDIRNQVSTARRQEGD